jgi:hypothetical protein
MMMMMMMMMLLLLQGAVLSSAYQAKARKNEFPCEVDSKC